MPGNLTNTLYPPQVNTFMPAFVNTTDAVIYFSLSPYNSSNDIQRVHVSLVNQLNNENALNNASGILMSSLRYDTSSGMYFVVIPVTSVSGNQFNINQFYKVQLRFDCYDGEVPTDDKQLTTYLLDCQTYFSEWSTVCLIKPILQPSIQLRQFDTYEGENTISFNQGIIPISGKLIFGDGNVTETETLQSYQIQVLEKNSDNVILETSTIYTGDNLDPNDINYKIDLQGLSISEGTTFRLRVNITTKNQYTLFKTWEFEIADFLDEETFDPSLVVEMNNEEGIATLKVTNVQTVFGNIYIKRGSSIDNFETWEEFYSTHVAGPIDLTLEDNTVSSLVWYRYSIQLENSAGGLTQVYRSNIFMPEFYDAILSRGTQQLKILYNYTISSFKPVVNRAKIDTLGGRYPKFAENAILNYKQFSISGFISSEADPHEKFLDKEDYFGDNYQRYQVYKQDMGIKDLVRNDCEDYNQDNTIYNDYLTTTKDDWLWEREFREEAIKWLNDGEPKLYRSMTEGNMAVMLTDINLTPNTQLSRRLYTFTATVYEIAEANSLTDLDTLGIFNVTKIDKNSTGSSSGGSIDPEPEYIEVIKVGQLYQYEIVDKNNILSVILNNLKIRYGGVLEDKNPDDLYLKSVKIFFHNKPNVYMQTNQNLELIENPGSSAYNNEQRNRMIFGYTFNVGTSASEGDSLIFVNDRGFYQLPENLDITRLSFDRIGDIVTIEYVMVYKEKNNVSSIISGQSVDRTVVGQEEGVFEPNVYLGEQIRAKYNFVKTDSYYQRMQYWRGICLDVTPFAVAHIRYYKEDTYNDYVVGETGVLHMLKDVPVQDMCFLGRRMKQQDISRQRFLEEWEYALDENEYSSAQEITSPMLNVVYSIENNLKIYYQYQWYNFKETSTGVGLAAVPVQGAINYLGNVVQSDIA